MAEPKPTLAPWVLGATAALALGVLAWAWFGFQPAETRRGADVSAATPSARSPSVAATSATPDAIDATDEEIPLERLVDPTGGWSGVDLEALRDEMPDNLYWSHAAPTSDERVKRERDERARNWDREFGKVQANTATDEEIEAFYGYKQRLSSDYVEFTSTVLDRYGESLNERDRRLLELSRTLHLARLSEIPRKLAEAYERADAHRQARRDWLESEAEFRGEAPTEPVAGGSGT